MNRVTQLHVNGAVRHCDADPQRPLLSVLRDDLGLTGCKYGCGEGQCGACTVLLDGQMTRSCITLAGDVGARPVTTIEGLEKNGKLHPVQQAFLEADALQCGYCTPGMILSSVALLRRNPQPTDAQVVRALRGNVCRCGTYPRILRAIHSAGRAMKGGQK